MANLLDSTVIFERYVQSRTILSESIHTYNPHSNDLILESVLEEGLGDFFKKVGSNVKSFASKAKDKVTDVITSSLLSKISPSDKEKALRGIEQLSSGKPSKSLIDIISKYAKLIFGKKTVNESVYSDILTESVIEELLYGVLVEAKKLSPEEALAKMQAQREKRNASRKARTTQATPKASAPVVQTPSPADQLTVSKYVKAIVDLLNDKYKTAEKRASEYAAIDSKIRNKLGQDVNDILKKNQVFGNIERIGSYKTTARTKLTTHLVNYIADEFVKYTNNNNIEGDKVELLNDIFKLLSFENQRQTILVNGIEHKLTPPAQIPETLNDFKDWFKHAFDKLDIKKQTDYNKFRTDLLKKVKTISKLPETNSKIEASNAEDKQKADELVSQLGTPNEEENTPTETTQQSEQSFLSRIWNFIKEHKVLTAGGVVAIVAIIAYATGGTSLLLPLIVKGLKSSGAGLIGAGISAGKQKLETGNIDWKRVGKSALSAGLGSMAISMVGGLASDALANTFDGDTSTTENSDLSTSDEPQAPEGDSTEEQPEETTGELADDSEEIFKKLNKSDFDPNSLMDKKKLDIINTLKSQDYTGSDLIKKYNELVSKLPRNPAKYSW